MELLKTGGLLRADGSGRDARPGVSAKDVSASTDVRCNDVRGGLRWWCGFAGAQDALMGCRG